MICARYWIASELSNRAPPPAVMIRVSEATALAEMRAVVRNSVSGGDLLDLGRDLAGAVRKSAALSALFDAIRLFQITGSVALVKR